MAFNPATTFTGTTVENADQGNQSISIKTKEGQPWTLHVANRELLKKHDLRKGDKVSVEVKTDNDVSTIAKADEPTGDPGQASSR